MFIKKKLCIFLLTIIVISTFLPYATTLADEPPWRSQSFDDVDEMLEHLQEYLEANLEWFNEYYGNIYNRFPFDYNGGTWNLRQLIIPTVNSFSLSECYFYHSTVVFKYYDRDSTIEIHIFRHASITIRQYNLEYRIDEGNIKRVVHNNTAYYIETERNNRYSFFVDDILVFVIDSEPFSQERVDLIQFQETGILFPAFVRTASAEENGQRSVENGNHIQLGLLIVVGGAMTLIIISVYIIITLRKNRYLNL